MTVRATKAKRRSKRRPGKAQLQGLKIIERNAASIDIGASSHFVAVPVDCDEQPVREFTSFTSDLHALADWLETCSVTTVARESTGVYWIRLYDLLEERGIESFSSMLNTSKAFQDARVRCPRLPVAAGTTLLWPATTKLSPGR